MDKQKVTIDITPQIVQQAKSNTDNGTNKMSIEFDLLRTYPKVNNNGDSYDFETAKQVYDTVEFGYINLEHEEWINIGAITASEFIDKDEYGVITCKGVLWKSVLDEFDISTAKIQDGEYQVSMEVYFKDYYVMVGDERYNLPEAEEYVKHRGSTLRGKEVARVIVPMEYSGAALTKNAADKTLDIRKAIAKKYDLTKGGNDNVFKTFETEEGYNKFLEEKKTEIASQLKEDEDFISEITEDYMKVDKVIAKFEEAGIEDVQELDDVITKFNEVKEEFEDYKKEIAAQKKLNERKATLVENDIDIEKLEASDEDIVEMGDKAFEMLVKASVQASEKAQEKKVNAKDDDKKGFDPTNINDGNEDTKTKDIINAL